MPIYYKIYSLKQTINNPNEMTNENKNSKV
jgi:hypothetical protein